MIRFFKSLFSGKKVREPQPEAPYKVEAPAVAETVSIPVEGVGAVEVPVKPKKPAGARKAAASAKAADKAVKEKKPTKPRAKKAAK